MSDRDSALLRDMLDAARTAREFMVGKDRPALDQEKMLQFAVVRAIQIVGEAAFQVSQRTRVRLPQIDWQGIVGMRHKIVHDYLRVDLNIVWDVVTNDLPSLIAELEKLLPPKAE